MNENADIFVYTHKPFKQVVKNNVYKVLTCSHEEFQSTLPVLRDYEGENISDKNLMYNEYSGIYWIWKNYDVKDYIGLNHYRRYYEWFDNVPDIGKIFDFFPIILNKPIDLICPQTVEGYEPMGTVMDNETWYRWWHNIDDFKLLEQLYHEKYPEYIEGFNRMKKSNFIYNSSMFTMKRDMFYEYCDYIFSVLEDYNNLIGLHTKEEYIKHVEENKEKYIKEHLPYYNVEMQSRILGYIAERAMNAFMLNPNSNGKTLSDDAAKITWHTVK